MSIYVLDTCVIRELLFHFRKDIPAFDRMWSRIDQMILSGEIVFVKESYSELEKQCTSEENLNWLKGKRIYFTPPTNEECKIVAEIYSKRNFQNNVARKNILNGQPVADAFLVARAKLLGGNTTVVSRELLKPNAAKIPNICEELGVTYMDDKEFQKIILP
ncbi:DUF4411 family protein [Sporofaciens musculi]|uniref:DUF4411 family protein n=1 Tax=Sporofaciens musculi TaxID=2681861 RepID=UPI0025A1A9E0|nr:DUF4411 family protein [Sporofaciens musculi]